MLTTIASNSLRRTIAAVVLFILAAGCAVAESTQLRGNASPSDGPAAGTRFTHGLLWQISRAGSAPSYVFGTIHSEDPRVMELPDAVREAFEGSQMLVLEVVPDIETLATASQLMYLPDDRTLRDLTGPVLFDRTADALAAYGIPREAVLRLKPWAAFTTLSMPKPRTGVYLDLALYLDAVQRGKPSHPLESAMEQLSIFDDMLMEHQVALLEAVLDGHDELEAEVEALIRAYLDRDLATLLAISEYDTPQDEILDGLMDRLLDDRNSLMVERMRPYLEQGHAFIAIGALHLAGRRGVLQQLQDHGYRVEVRY